MKKPQVLLGLLAAVGTVIGVLVALVGLPYGRVDYTAFASAYHQGTPAPDPFHMLLDCEATAGIQDGTGSQCTYAPGGSFFDVFFVVENNSGGPAQIGDYQFKMVDPNTAIVESNGVPTDLTGAGYSCGLPAADDDTGEGGPGTRTSLLVCYAPTVAPTIPNGGTLTLGKTPYQTVGVGDVVITLKDTGIFDQDNNELATCNPVISFPGDCFPATIHVANPPTSTNTPIPPTNTATNTPTNTNTATATNTPTDTPTPTATPAGSSVVKVCTGNANNCDNSIPAANLFLCTTGPCSGPNEGDLHVHENASNVQTGDQNGDTVQDGLGAYEFKVEYDNDVIQSVNPCDFVFGPANGVEGPGAGAARGPVDELNSSAVNPDCTPDPGPVNNGTCTMSQVFENVINFGCVTSGQVPGPTGSFTLASLQLIPHPDLTNDIFPGNDNGVLTVIKDNDCELVDVFGHPTLGSVNGGLTPVCGDMAVTVRILEGDLNLDCQVNLQDEALIAYRYGAFFGSLLYSKWFDLEPNLHDLDIDIKDLQKVFGRDGSTCQNPIPAQTPAPPPVPFGN